MTEYADYMEVWRWTSDGKEIANIYDSYFFISSGLFPTDDIDLRKCQTISNTIIVLDLMNGLHILQLTNIGQLQYRTTI